MSAPRALKLIEEDIGAVVFDIGNSSMRVGFASNARPFDIPSAVGTRTELRRSTLASSDLPPDFSFDDAGYPLFPVTHRFIDVNNIYVARECMEIVNYMNDSMIKDWDTFENVVEYAYGNYLVTDSLKHPVLISEPVWNLKDKREKLTELMFEKFNVPAFFLVKTPVLAAFGSGHSTALVVDCGATQSSAIVVKHGFVLDKCFMKTPIGGEYITSKCEEFLMKNHIAVVPLYKVRSKEAVGKNQEARWVRKLDIPDVTESWHNLMMKRVVQDFQSTVLQFIQPDPFKEGEDVIPPVHYEFPNGYNQDFGGDVQQIPESLFNPTEDAVGGQNPILGIGQIAFDCVTQCENMKFRKRLLNNIVLAGGSTLTKGFAGRFWKDLTARLPQDSRIKVVTGSSTTERRYGTWIGGACLTTSPMFKEFWISRKEYDEGGKEQVSWKCP